MLLQIHPDNPQDRLVQMTASYLKNGGVMIYPTDTVYAFGCDINSKKAVERIAKLKGISPEKAQFSCICPDLKTAGEYAIQISNPVFKLMRKVLPGPYTFILKASKKVPRHFQSKKKTVGIRIFDHPISMMLIKELGNPLFSSSLPMDEENPMSTIDPEQIYLRYGKLVDIVIDDGMGGTDSDLSTVLDCSDGEIVVVREGKGVLE